MEYLCRRPLMRPSLRRQVRVGCRRCEEDDIDREPSTWRAHAHAMAVATVLDMQMETQATTQPDL
jgi:hypothetical protein